MTVLVAVPDGDDDDGGNAYVKVAVKPTAARIARAEAKIDLHFVEVSSITDL